MDEQEKRMFQDRLDALDASQRELAKTQVDLQKWLVKLDTKVAQLCATVATIQSNEQRHVWALILMLAGTLIPLILKVLNMI